MNDDPGASSAPLAPPHRAIRALAALAAIAMSGAALAAAPAAQWTFEVRLDGEPIGTHRFVVSDAGHGGFIVDSDASFDVRWLGFPIYRYRHDARERWTRGCLEEIEARTDDNGKTTRVQGSVSAGRFDLRVRDPARPAPALATLPRCVMSFAYWNPALAGQGRLLDPGTGRFEAVAMGSPPALPSDLPSFEEPLRGLRIAGLAQPIDVWYAGDRWVGLDTTVAGGRRLSYRLQ